ncbi:MAG: hypothetical protein JWP14_3395 [Frankiales bacterium]|nr:hypothetical protein [Frankiales bacterium]
MVATTPRGAKNADQLKLYWTKSPEGLAKWATHPHPWTTLYHHLVKFVNPEFAKRLTETYFVAVFGIHSGTRKGKNPTGPG